MIEIGLSYVAGTVVSAENTAGTMGSGDMDVFATPAMVALMEQAAMTAVGSELEEGQSTVGTKINVSHVKASPVGAKIEAEALLKEVDGRRLVFFVKASDEHGVIGEGVHERFVVDTERFLAKLK